MYGYMGTRTKRGDAHRRAQPPAPERMSKKSGEPSPAGYCGIQGLVLKENFITTQEELILSALAEAGTWSQDISRPTQQYGWKYDYKKRRVTAFVGPLPDWLRDLGATLIAPNLLSAAPDQAIINKYLPGHEIAKHKDSRDFDDRIASVSLLAGCYMLFKMKRLGSEQRIFLPARSVLLLSGEARKRWTHEIPAAESVITHSASQTRCRISITFRTVLETVKSSLL
jgi:alkylated DNA repair dioxygenase AlkB